MNIREYISSGILEAFVLGDLSEKERADVEKNILEYPELKKELANLEDVQEQLLLHTAIHPRTSVRTGLMEKIEHRPRQKVVPLRQEGSRLNYWRLAVAASVALALMSSYLAYNYRSKLTIAETTLNQYIAQNQRMAQEYNNVNSRLDKVEDDLKVMENPAFKQVAMKGTGNAPGSLAFAYWNSDTRELFLRVQNMKELAANNQYQLWAIVDGKPVDAGVFDATFTGLLKMKEIGGAAAFAVTIEPRGGQKNPTLETMQVIGNVEKG